MMNEQQLIYALEAILFASSEPLSKSDLNKICERAWSSCSSEEKKEQLQLIDSALDQLKRRWQPVHDVFGFCLQEVANGLCFRSNPKYADYIKALKEARPVRLSKAALETLSIIAYRQPVTKPDIDHIRGVDCGGTLRLLLERSLIRIVGKKEEPGLPLLYSTTKNFLDFFNLANLTQLPTLKEFHELSEESQTEIEAWEEYENIEELQQNAKSLRSEEEPAAQSLDHAVDSLKRSERSTRSVLAEHGIVLKNDPEKEVAD